jgi:hypothetical protein
MVTGVLLHEGILEPIYEAHPTFWRPELMREPTDMAALLPRWIVTGLAGAFILAGIYDNVRGAFSGSGWTRGVKYGAVVALIYAVTAAGWSGVFNLPDLLWFWWVLEGFFLYCLCGAVLGWFIARYGNG